MTDEAPTSTFDPRAQAVLHARKAEQLLDSLEFPEKGAPLINAQQGAVRAQRAQAHADLANFWLGSAMDDDARRPITWEPDNIVPDANDRRLIADRIAEHVGPDA